MSTATVIQEEREAGRAAAVDTRGARHARQSVSRFVEGKARYIADIRAEGCLEAAFARSPVARGEIVEVDLSPALAPNGPAVAGLTGRDAVARTAPMPCSWHIASHATYDYWCLPHEQVLYAGDPVAAVAAATAHEAQHAASLVAVTISELPAVTDVAQAADGNVLLRPETGTNVLYEAAAHGAASTGDAYPVAAAAEPTESHISRLRALPAARMALGRFRTARVTAVPMEPRGCLAEVTGGQLRLYSSTQIPVMLKRVLVEVLGLPESRVEVIAPDIGGGFGIKIAVAREEIAVCLLALQTGRPVRWIEDTIEHLTNAPHGRDEVNDVAIAYSPAGKILGMHVDCLSDVGAYSVSPLSSAIEAAAVPVRLPSVYELGDYSYRSRAVATNKPPLGTYRGVAAPVGVFIVERLLQDIAADTGVDFADIQRQNFLPEGVPTRNAAGVPYDPGRYRNAFELMISKLGYAGLRAEQSRRRERRRARAHRHRDERARRAVRGLHGRPGAAGGHRLGGCVRPAQPGLHGRGADLRHVIGPGARDNVRPDRGRGAAHRPGRRCGSGRTGRTTPCTAPARGAAGSPSWPEARSASPPGPSPPSCARSPRTGSG